MSSSATTSILQSRLVVVVWDLFILYSIYTVYVRLYGHGGLPLREIFEDWPHWTRWAIACMIMCYLADAFTAEYVYTI